MSNNIKIYRLPDQKNITTSKDNSVNIMADKEIPLNSVQVGALVSSVAP